MRLEDYDIKLIVKSDKDILNGKTLPLEIEEENQRILNDAIDEICRLDLLGIYERVIVD